MVSSARTEDARFVCPACWQVFADGGVSACPDCAAAPPAEGWPSMPCSFRDRYVLTAQIGRDAAAALFHARSSGAGEPRVLLEIARARGPLAVDVDARKLFRREATVAGLLGEESDAFLGLSSIDVTEPMYLAFEHVPWPALGDVLAESGPFPAAAAARVGVAILHGLTALERRRLVHRALAPSRIFVHRRHDGGYDVKIAGLGVWPESDEGAALAPSPEILPYASPEQLRGEPLTAASDVHMVASILWELVTGEVPYPLVAGASTQVAVKQRLRGLARVPARPAAMPPELHELLATALHPDARERCPEGAPDGSPVAGLGSALERFAEEFPRRQEHALGATTRALAVLETRLAPLRAIVDRKDEIEATLARLAGDPGAPGALRAAEEALAELAAEVDRFLSSPSSAPAISNAPPPREPVSIAPPPEAVAAPVSIAPPEAPVSIAPPEAPISIAPPEAPAAEPDEALPSLPPPSTRAQPDSMFPGSASVPPDPLDGDGIPGVGGSRWPYVVGVLVVAALAVGGAVMASGSKGAPSPGATATVIASASAPPLVLGASSGASTAASPVVSAAPPASASAAPDAGAAPSASAAPPRPKPRPQRARPPEDEPAADPE